MSDNTRRILHEIIVYDYKYHWCSVDFSKDDGCKVKIWKDDVKIFDEFMLISNVTTAFIRKKIREIMNYK